MAKRIGKIYIDYLRNGRGASAIIPYSTEEILAMEGSMPDFPSLEELRPTEDMSAW